MRRVLGAATTSLAFAGLLAAFACGPAPANVIVLHPGLDASSYLSSATPSMIIEVTPVAGRAPDQNALNLLLLRATEHCAKPGGIRLVVDPEVPATATTTSLTRTVEDLQAFENAHRQVNATPDTIVLYIEYIDGTLLSPPSTLGASFGPHSIAIFKDQITNVFPDIVGPMEGRVLVHELGHELGLVNEGTAMLTPHEDTAHPGHDLSPNCVMFWTLHGGSLAAGDLPPDDYDPLCKADLKAAGGL